MHDSPWPARLVGAAALEGLVLVAALVGSAMEDRQGVRPY